MSLFLLRIQTTALLRAPVYVARQNKQNDLEPVLCSSEPNPYFYIQNVSKHSKYTF